MSAKRAIIIVLITLYSLISAAMIQSSKVDLTLTHYFSTASPAVVVGFGSLMSKKSASSTFPTLTNFRSVRVEGYRRVFTHPTAIFFERGIADLASKRMASLSIEKCDGHSFIGTVFCLHEGEDANSLLSREEEFGFEIVR